MSRKGVNQLSLETFDPNSRREPILNSPRSLEACRRQGIDPSELLARNFNEIREMYKDRKLDEEGYRLMLRHYEDRRLEKLRVLIEEREDIIEDERNGIINFNSVERKSASLYGSGQFSASKTGFQSKNSQHGSGVDAGIIEREKRQLEKIKYRQEREVKQVMDHELKMQEIREKQEEKMMKVKERQEMHELRVQQSRKEAEERKRQKDLEKKMREEEEALMQKTAAQKAYEREMDFARREREKEQERRYEARAKDEEKKQRHEEFVKQTEEKLMEQQMRVDARRREMEEKDKIRQENLQIQQQQRKMMSDEQRRIHEEKINQAKFRNEENLEQRRHQFFHKKSVAEERKRELDEIAEIERRQKIEADQQKQEYRAQVKHQNDDRLQNRIGGLLQRYHEMDEKVAATQENKKQELQMKHNIEAIKHADKQENIKRISKMQQYHRDQIFEKILSDNERSARIKYERQNLMDARLNMRKEMEDSKRKLLEDFDKGRGKKSNMEMSLQSTEKGRESGSRSNLYSAKALQSPHYATSPQANPGAKPFVNKSLSRKNSEKKRPNTSDQPQRQRNKNANSEAQREIEQIRIKHNHDMLMVLEEEQENERQRELQLRSTHDQQGRKRLEKVFGMERAKAHARIQQLADQHDDEVQQVMEKYNMASS